MTTKRLTKMSGIKFKGVDTNDGSVEITILDKESNGDILRVEGTSVPHKGTDGYAKGCIFFDTDVAAGTRGAWINIGTSSACNFALITSA
jgi:hypothetical protein